MMDRNMLYQNSSKELTFARNCQALISQKEFEIRIMDINNQYSPYNLNNYLSNMQKQTVQLKIDELKNKRNNHIINAIDYALQLADRELNEHVVFAMASIAISSINSFLAVYQIHTVSLPRELGNKLETIYRKLVSYNNTLLQTGVMKLKEYDEKRL